MRGIVLRHVETICRAHKDLAESLPEEAFSRDLPIPSNTIGAQFWCVIGARESYANSISQGDWMGFACSLPGSATGDKAKVLEALDRSHLRLERVADGVEWNDAREELLADLLEHEALHQGQLIRYVYGLGHRFPDSWADRWSLTQPA